MEKQMRLMFEPLPVSEPPPSSAPPISREQARSRRKRDVRARTVSVRRMPKSELEKGRLLYPEDEHDDIARPKTRADCKGGARPCPFVSCKHHLYLDVSAKTGAIKLNFPDLEPWELANTCALDVADRDGTTLEGVGAIMNLTRERVRQIEVKALAKTKAEIEMRELRDLVGEGSVRSTKRRLPIVSEDDVKSTDDFDVASFAGDELDDV